MATLKHISSKNANYGAAEQYLTFEHDEFSGKEIRDKHGHLIPREEYRMDTLLCGDDDFAIACMKANLQYEKNNQRGDVKSHHYIISYDPRDAADHGLTIDQAQMLGVEFCRQHFPGHQAMIVTHPDGHNHSGNIHTHIVINSLRVEDVPLMPYMDRACDTKAGMKHRCTAAFFRYLRAEVMEMCHHHGLHQIDLLNGSKNRVTEKEYWVQRRAEQKLEQQAVAEEDHPNLISAGTGDESTDSVSANKASSPTKFETDKEKLRQTLRTVLADAVSLDGFFSRLSQFGITVKESRGRFSYLTADRTKPITSRKLGDDFSKEAILSRLKENAERKRLSEKDAKEQAVVMPIPAPTAQYNVPVAITSQQQIPTVKTPQPRDYYVTHGFQSKEELEAVYMEASGKASDLVHQINGMEDQIKGRKTLQRHVQNYKTYRDIHSEWQGIRRDKKRIAFYEDHRMEVMSVEEAIRYFKEHELSRLPSVKKLQEEIEGLIRQKNGLYQQYESAQMKADELLTIRNNDPKPQRQIHIQEQEKQTKRRHEGYVH